MLNAKLPAVGVVYLDNGRVVAGLIEIEVQVVELVDYIDTLKQTGRSKF